MGKLVRSNAVGGLMNMLLRSFRVGRVGSIQLVNLQDGGVFYRSAKCAIEWIFYYSPERYYRLARDVVWLVNRRLVQGPGSFVPFFHWRSLMFEFKDLDDEDLSAAYLAHSLVMQGFLLRHRYNGNDLSDEQLLRIGRLAHRDAAHFLGKLERDFPELARRAREVDGEFDPDAFLAKQRMPYLQQTKYVPPRKPAKR